MESELEPCRIDFEASGAEESEPESLPVYLRIKPIDSDELSIKIVDDKTIETNHKFRANKKSTFSHVFNGPITQQEIFDVTTAPLLTKFLDGANVMTFAYGVTSSGKTYTIMGDHSQPGIIPLTLEKVFGSFRSKIQDSDISWKPVMFDGAQPVSEKELNDLEKTTANILKKVKKGGSAFDQYAFANTTCDLGMAERRPSSRFTSDACNVWISVYEIYNEVITDLLDTAPKGKRKALAIGQDPKGCTFVKDLVQIPVFSAAEAYGILQVAKQNLAKASTKLNDNSSRSHMVFTIKMVHTGGSLAEPLVNQFVIGDLAGSERQSKTGASGTLLKQASAINSSLMVLGRCLEALRKKDKTISAPFRDSKLTRMLNPFFTVAGYVSLIICINPHVYLQDETMETIRFSAIASEIVQDPVKPIERLRQLRRLTQEYIVNSPEKSKDDEVLYWRDAVYGSVMYDGVKYLEVKASYFKDMARDILRAEKMLTANDEEIETLQNRLKILEVSNENLTYMHDDRMKEQRETHNTEFVNMKNWYDETIQQLMEEHEEEAKELKRKYTKYSDGYVKLSKYIQEKLWPEVVMFRERFGCLPEYPPKEGTDVEVAVKPENSIKYWQDMLEERDCEVQAIKRKLAKASEESKESERELTKLKQTVMSSENEFASTVKELKEAKATINALEDKVLALKNDTSDREALIDEVASLKEDLRQNEEIRQTLVASHKISEDDLRQQCDSIKAELREKFTEVEENAEKLKLAEARVESLQKALRSLEGNSSDEILISEIRRENERLINRCSHLEMELKRAQDSNMALQDSLLSLQEKVDAVDEHRQGFKEREKELVMKVMTEASRSSDLESQNVEFEEQIRSIQKRLDEQRETSTAKTVLIETQAAELEVLRDKVESLRVLGTELGKYSEENQQLRDRLKASSHEKESLRDEVQRARELQIEVEFLTKKLENQTSRYMRGVPQTERPCRRRRSQSTSELDILKPPNTERSRRRLRLGNEENFILDTTLEGTIRDPSPMATPYRTRASNRRR